MHRLSLKALALPLCLLTALIAVSLPQHEPFPTPVDAPAPAITSPSPEPLPSSAAVPSQSKETDPFAAFDAWLKQHALHITTSQATDLLTVGLTLAEKRRDAMLKLMESDPQTALAKALPTSSRKTLPTAFESLIEENFSVQGDLALVAAVPRPGFLPRRTVYRELRVGDRAWEAFVHGRRTEQQTIYDTPLSGIRLGKLAAIREDSARILSMEEVPPAAVLEEAQTIAEHATASNPTSPATRVVEIGNRYYPVCCQKHAKTLADTLQAQYHTRENFTEAAGGNANSDTAPTFAPSAHTTGTKSVLVIVADFSDAPGVPVDEESGLQMTSSYLSNRMVNQVAPFLQTVSYSNTQLGTITITPLQRLTGTLASYAKNDNVNGIKNAALTKAAASGFNHNNYDRVILVFADTFGITGNKWTWSGLADLGGKFIWNNAWFTLGTVSHELLHTYGLRHANLWMPPIGSTNPVDLNGESLEYGDVFDVMGEGPFNPTTMPDHPNTWFLSRLGWLPNSAVQSITTSGTYRLYRYDHPDASMANPLTFYLDRDGTRQYWISFRSKYTGHSTHSAAANGACLNWGYRTNVASDLIDTTPLDDASNAPLQVGSTFNDAAAGVSFQVTAKGGTAPHDYIDIAIQFQSRVVLEAPVMAVDEKAGAAVLKVYRRGSSAGAISVDYNTLTGTAGAADFTSTSGELNWAAGDTTTRTITVPITADSVAETPETFTIRLSDPVNCVLSHGNQTLVRINDPGAVDSTFAHEEIYGSIYDMVTQPDGRTVIGGYFTAYGAMFSDGIVRIHPDGTVDQSFEQGAGANALPVGAVARQPDGKILVGGKFTAIRGGNRNFLARLNVDGTLDTTFNPGTGPNVPANAGRGINCIVVQPDGKILVGGQFTTWNGTPRKCMARLHPDGSLDTSFQDMDNLTNFYDTANGVRSIAICPTSSAPYFAILVGGFFNSSSTSSGIMRIKADGTLDTSFSAPQGARDGTSDTVVSAITVQPDGKVLVGGQFTSFNGATARRMARLNDNGTNDSAFVTAVGAGLAGGSYIEVSNFVYQPDGKITVAGFFTSASGATALKGLVRYLPTGARDTTFVANHTGATGVGLALLQPDNQLLAGMWDGINPTDYVRRFTSGISGESAGVIEFASSAASVTESSADTILVHRVGGSQGAISVHFHSVPGSALDGADYTTIQGTLTWASGDTSPKSIPLNAAMDALAESGETYSVQLSTPLGGAFLGSRAVSTVTILDAPSNAPVIGFTSSSSSVAEDAGDHQISIQLTGPDATSDVTATLLLSGTATSGQDFIVSTSVLIPEGATTLQIPLTILDDSHTEGNETITLTLSAISGAILNAAAASHTVTIVDNEVPPGITDPAPQLVNVGDTAVFSVVVQGSPAPTLQWFKGPELLPGQTGPTLTLTNVQLTSAGAYHCVATSGSSSATSASATLGVVDTMAVTRVLNLGTSTTFTVVTAGTGQTFRWHKGATPLSNGTKYSGVTGKTLTINALAAPDAGDYTCKVTSTAGDVNGGTNVLKLISLPPLISPANPLGAARVGAVYDPDGGAPGYEVPRDLDPARTPSSFSQVGLPAGLQIHPITGVIYGRPTASKSTAYNVTITASNARGKHTMATQLFVDALPPNAVGTFIGLIPRHDPLTLLLGGRFDLTTLPSGSCSGSIALGGIKHTFTGLLQSQIGSDIVSCSTIVKRVGNSTLLLNFSIDGSTGRIVGATLTDSTNPAVTVSFDAWRRFPATEGQRGYYTLHLSPPPSPHNAEVIPQGTGYASFTVATSGTLNLIGRLPDGTSFSSAGHISTANKVLVCNVLYTRGGSIHGLLEVLPGALPGNPDATLTADSLLWSRLPHTGRAYPSGFSPLPLTVHGSRYIPPPAIGPVVMSLPNEADNASLTFTPFDCEMIPPLPDLITQIKTNGTTTKAPSTPNPRSTTLLVTNSTGYFTGTATLKDTHPTTLLPVTRPLTFHGIIVTHPVHGSTGHGAFTLSHFAVPGVAVTPIMSGGVRLDPAR